MASMAQVEKKPESKGGVQTPDAARMLFIDGLGIPALIAEELKKPTTIFAIHRNEETPDVLRITWSLENGDYMTTKYDKTTGQESGTRFLNEDEFTTSVRSSEGLVSRYLPPTVSASMALRLGQLENIVPVPVSGELPADKEGEALGASDHVHWNYTNSMIQTGPTCAFYATTAAIGKNINVSMTAEQLIAAIDRNPLRIKDAVNSVLENLRAYAKGEAASSTKGLEIVTGGMSMEGMKTALKNEFNINTELIMLEAANMDEFASSLSRHLQNGPLVFGYNAYGEELYEMMDEMIRSGQIGPEKLRKYEGKILAGHAAVLTGMDIVRDQNGIIDADRSQITYITTGAGRQKEFGGVNQRMSLHELLVRSAYDLFSVVRTRGQYTVEILKIQDSPEARVPGGVEVRPVISMTYRDLLGGQMSAADGLGGVGINVSKMDENIGVSVSGYAGIHGDMSFTGEARVGDGLWLKLERDEGSTDLTARVGIGKNYYLTFEGGEFHKSGNGTTSAAKPAPSTGMALSKKEDWPDFSFSGTKVEGSESASSKAVEPFSSTETEMFRWSHKSAGFSFSGPLGQDYSFGIYYGPIMDRMALAVEGNGLRFTLEYVTELKKTNAGFTYNMSF